MHASTCVCMLLFLCCGACACVRRLGLPVCGSAGEQKWGRDDPRPGPHVLVCRPITHTSACVAPVLLSQGPGRFPGSMQFLEHRVYHHLLSLIICLCLNSVTQPAKVAGREQQQKIFRSWVQCDKKDDNLFISFKQLCTREKECVL